MGAAGESRDSRHLVENPDGSVLLVDGDGSEFVIGAPENGEAVLVSPPEDFSTMEKFGDGRYRRTFPNQTVHQFDSAHRLASMTDRSGNATVFTYDDAGRLSQITDPAAAVTHFHYVLPATSLTRRQGSITTVHVTTIRLRGVF